MRILLSEVTPDVFQCSQDSIFCSVQKDWQEENVRSFLSWAKDNEQKTVFFESGSIALASLILGEGLKNVKFVFQSSNPQLCDVELLLTMDNALIDNGEEKLSPTEYLYKYYPSVIHQTIEGTSTTLIAAPESLCVLLLKSIVDAQVSRHEAVDFLLSQEFSGNLLASEWQVFLCEALLLSYSDNPASFAYYLDHIHQWIEKIDAGEFPWNVNITIRHPSRQEIIKILNVIDAIRAQLPSPGNLDFKLEVLGRKLQHSFRRLGIVGPPGPMAIVSALKVQSGFCNSCGCSTERVAMLERFLESLNCHFRGICKSYQVRFDQHISLPFGSLEQSAPFMSDEKPGVIFIKSTNRGGFSLENQEFCAFSPTHPVQALVFVGQELIE